MPTMKEQTIQETNERFGRIEEMLKTIQYMLNHKYQYDYDRIILEVEDYLKEIG